MKRIGPSTYELALKNNIQLLDASCPIVLKLQQQVKIGHKELKNIDGQVVIYGKEGHAEVIGLLGQTNNDAIIVGSYEDLDKIDFKSAHIRVFSNNKKSSCIQRYNFRNRKKNQKRVKQ